jgi:hypothetical protein
MSFVQVVEMKPAYQKQNGYDARPNPSLQAIKLPASLTQSTQNLSLHILQR